MSWAGVNETAMVDIIKASDVQTVNVCMVLFSSGLEAVKWWKCGMFLLNWLVINKNNQNFNKYLCHKLLGR